MNYNKIEILIKTEEKFYNALKNTIKTYSSKCFNYIDKI